jgi:osmoprotectant transport system ATP-binding protein
MLESVGLDPARYAQRYPESLSGGEQQRVGIARALVSEPSLLLCDEPFGALDPIVRRELQQLFVRLRRERGTTMLFVTHDLAEALFVADRVVLIDAGRIAADAPAGEFTSLDEPIVRRFVEASRIGEAS